MTRNVGSYGLACHLVRSYLEAAVCFALGVWFGYVEAHVRVEPDPVTISPKVLQFAKLDLVMHVGRRPG